MENKRYADMLSYQIKDPRSKFDYDSYCAPLYWFIKLYCKSTSLTMKKIEEKLHYSSGVLTKKLRTDNKQHHALTAADLENICSVLNTPLSSILFLYGRRDIIEKSNCSFDKLTNLISNEFEKVLDLSCSSQDLGHKKLSNSSTLSSDRDDSILDSWRGKWFFYFPSSDSTIVDKREKNLTKSACNAPDDSELKELYDLYSEDHIFSGTLHIDKKDHQHMIHLKYLTNPESQTILQYEGTAIISPNEHAIFTTLINEKYGDIMYLIIDTLSVEKNSSYIMASVLSLSRNRSEFHQRPCSLRMILSRNAIHPSSRTYKVMTANLMMNDSIIRIDDNGYEELKKHQEHYASPALDIFLTKYPDINMIKNESININVHKCAYIDEAILRNINGVSKKDTLYLEALLRLHSIAPWYSKVKAAKTNDTLKKISDDDIF